MANRALVRFRADGIWQDATALLTRAIRQQRGRDPEPATGILDSQSVVSGPQAGERGFDGNKKIKGIKRHVLTCALGFVLAVLVTAAHVHDTQAAGLLLDRAAQDGWALERVNHLHWPTDRRRRPAARPGYPGLDTRPRGQRVCAAAGALAH